MSPPGSPRRRGLWPEPLPPGLIDGLADASAYPHDPSVRSGVEHVQTHLSHVFLTGERVYKLRKAVDLGFVCFATRALRDADCLREVRLGRRLAPDVYLGVAPVEVGPPGVRVGPLVPRARAGDLRAEAGEHCVVMRRLAEGRDALSLLAAGRLSPRQIDAVARLVADFHRRHRLDARTLGTAAAWLERSVRPVRDNFVLLRPAAEGPRPIVSRTLLRRAEAHAADFVARHRDRFEARRRARRGVDGHGDLHLQHVFFERDDAPPLLIDCLEFRDDLRQIDAAADVAFLAMDLRYRGRARLAERFLAAYAAAADDFDLYSVVDYYVRYRAAVRAKVAAVAAVDRALPEPQRRAAEGSVRRHLGLAAQRTIPRGGPAVLALCGRIGTGKSTVARAAGEQLGGVVISSDVVRKTIPRPAYTERGKDRVYRALLDRAAPVVDSGRVAVLDATFDRARRRTAVLRWADARGVRALLIEVRCAPAIARARLARRAAEATDPSEAGPDQWARSVAEFEPPLEWPRGWKRVVRTDRPWRAALRAALAPLRADRRGEWYEGRQGRERP